MKRSRVYCRYGVASALDQRVRDLAADGPSMGMGTLPSCQTREFLLIHDHNYGSTLWIGLFDFTPAIHDYENNWEVLAFAKVPEDYEFFPHSPLDG